MTETHASAHYPRNDDAELQERIETIKKIPTARLRELATADAEGRVVVLPCKVGSDLWEIENDLTECSEFGRKYSEYSCAGCESACDSNQTKKLKRIKNVSLLCLGGWIASGCFGKSIFLTHEEAARALSEASAGKGE